MLNVTSLATEGAVSKATVEQMASGALELSGAEVSIAVSGIAGPAGGTEEKPVGTVWIAVGLRGEDAKSFRVSIGGGRDRVRRLSAVAAMLLARGVIEKKSIDTDYIWNYI